MSIDPVVAFFVLGLLAGLLRSDLKIPVALYETLSIYLLLAIGLKGGIALAQMNVSDILLPSLVIILSAALIPLFAFPILRYWGKLPRVDAGSIAAHYGSVSVVTYAVAVTYLLNKQVDYEGHMTVFLVFLEIPALLIGVVLARGVNNSTRWGVLIHEVLCGKAIVLLLGGLLIGCLADPNKMNALNTVYIDPFKGILSLFLLEMGLVTASRFASVRSAGVFLIVFGITVPICAALLGITTGYLLDLSLGGTTLLAVLYASASYIAAPATMRIAVPEANPALSIGAALGITFPFNIVLGIPLYYWLATQLYAYAGAH
ncbi:MAG: sodium-dependent bicarbonate transport family permease [Gammaproteobacteria bacterium]|nr:sodium-dependent bicarbonate transport family permease [Gammaproteobacteria bacterium]